MSLFEFRNVALTLLALKDSQTLKTRLNELGDALVSAIRPGPTAASPEGRSKIADAFLDAGNGAVRPLVDLIDLCAKLQGTNDAKWLETNAAIAGIARTTLAVAKGMIVSHKADRKFESLNGLGVFAAALTSDADAQHLDLGRPNYLSLMVAKGAEDTGWAPFVYDDLRPLLAPAHERVAEFVEQSGVVNPEDRPAVAQLWMGIDRAFQQLERDARTLRTELDAMDDSHPRDAAPVPDPAFLDLLDQHRRQQARQLAATARAGGTAPPAPPALPGKATPHLVQAAKLLRAVEQSLRNLERTARNAVTHDTLGLGFRAIKPQGGGLGDVKPQGGGLGDVKPQGGGLGDIKPQGGGLGASSRRVGDWAPFPLTRRIHPPPASSRSCRS